MALILVDVDGTLIREAASEGLFIRHLLARGLLGPRQLLAFGLFPGLMTHRFGRHVFKKNKAYLSGLTVQRVALEAAAFVEGTLLARVRPDLRARLQAHRRAGDYVVLLTGTPDFIAVPLARGLGADRALGSRCVVVNGRFTARPPLRHPFGIDKVLAAERLCRERGLTLADCVAYGDSIFDALLFERVGRAVAVAPDRALRLRAAREGWEVLV